MSENKFVRVVETQTVTDDALETVINDMVTKGWVLDGIHFSMRDSSKRPTMAFLIFFNLEYAQKMHLSKKNK